MIPPERDDKMLVTMTAGELYALMSKAARAAADMAVSEVFERLAAKEENPHDADIVVGGEAIAKAMGVDRSTLYRMLREGVLGDTVKQTGRGGRLVARRSELLGAMPSINSER